MVEYIYELIMYTFDIVKMLLVFKYIINEPMRSNKKNMVAVIMIGSVIAYIHSNAYEEKSPLVLYTVTMIIISIILIKANVVKTVFLSFWVICVFSMLDVISSILLKLILNISGFYDNKFIDISSSLITIAFLIILIKLIKYNNLRVANKLRIRYYVLFSILSFSNSIILGYILDFILNINLTGNKNVLYIAFIIMVLGVYIQMYLVIYLAAVGDFHKINHELSRKYLKIQQQHYEYIKENERETRKFRHDIKHHLYIINNMIAENNLNEIPNYLKQMEQKVSNKEYVIHTHNDIVDAIVNKIYFSAQEKEIVLDVNGHMPTMCNVDAFDLCVIFDNVLSNALEAVENCENKMIMLNIRFDNDNIYIREENEYCKVIKKNGAGFLTSKTDTDNHGFGLENIMDSVNKYNGLVDVDIDTKFQISIMLNNVKME